MPEDDGICRVAGRGRRRRGVDGDYYDLPHVRWAAVRPVPRICTPRVDAPLDNGRRKRIRRLSLF